MKIPYFVSYGGGINSTAMLVLLKSNNIVPDAILFADTEAEHPSTYQYFSVVNTWLKSIGFPLITMVKYESDKHQNLEQECLNTSTFPSKAYGHGTCSHKWKIEPQQKYKTKWLKDNGFQYHHNAVGFHAGEKSRLISKKTGELKPFEDSKHKTLFPLIENGIYQHHCIALIDAVGLPIPSKSSCFFCPSKKPLEILKLKEDYPDLFERAIAIENAGLKTARTVLGLGRRFAWQDIGKLTPIEQAILDAKNESCGCVDFEDDDLELKTK